MDMNEVLVDRLKQIAEYRALASGNHKDSGCVDWSFYNWGNLGPLEELKVLVSVDMNGPVIGLGFTAVIVDQDGEGREINDSEKALVDRWVFEHCIDLVSKVIRVLKEMKMEFIISDNMSRVIGFYIC